MGLSLLFALPSNMILPEATSVLGEDCVDPDSIAHSSGGIAQQFSPSVGQ